MPNIAICLFPSFMKKSNNRAKLRGMVSDKQEEPMPTQHANPSQILEDRIHWKVERDTLDPKSLIFVQVKVRILSNLRRSSDQLSKRLWMYQQGDKNRTAPLPLYKQTLKEEKAPHGHNKR
jgi:hypothetical protein